jgi:hypothetical protein
MIDMQNKGNTSADNQNSKVYSDFFKKTYKIWEDFVKNELITDEGDAIENTADGDIKVTLLTIKLTDEKAKGLASEISEVLSKDNAIKDSIIDSQSSYIRDNAKAGEVSKKLQEILSNLPQYVEKYKDKISIEGMKLTAKVDRDSYIISQVISGTVVIKTEGEIRVKFNINNVLSDINTGKIKIKIPDSVISKSVKIDESNFNNSEYMKKIYGK